MQRLLLALLAFLFFTASSLSDARKANSAFERGDYREAAALYRQAIMQDPDNPRLHFNLGNALYHLGEQDQAFEAYQRFQSLTELQQEQSLADYNKGRMLTDQERYEEALDHFRQALIRNPADTDAQYNFELASRRLQEQQEQQQQEPDSGEQDQDDQNENQDDQQPPQPDSDQQSDENEDSGEQPAPLDMTPEEAEAILDALEQLERELLENQKKESTESQSGNERDW
ncbi:MAG: tetratricopeptide repeat protein [Balneolaceae bacterium]|nr:MAG: tetratricopeptide repeat protein [Balneolaceae bacterium]